MKYTNYFTYKKRNDGTRFYCLSEDNSTLKGLIRSIHKDLYFDCLPDDWVYEQIYSAFERLENETTQGGFEDAVCEIEGDVYTRDLLDWAKAGWAQEYISEASREYGAFNDIDDQIRSGQRMAISAIYYAVWDYIEIERNLAESEEANND